MRNNKEITLAEFLGWEEGEEYKCLGDTYRINNDAFQVEWHINKLLEEEE